MKLDYPLYKKLCRRKHPAAKWWKLGGALYYLGLVTGNHPDPYGTSPLAGACGRQLPSLKSMVPVVAWVLRRDASARLVAQGKGVADGQTGRDRRQ